jgi:lipoprotein-releasing system permease protein
MNFPWFIAKKYIFLRKDSPFINLISVISIIGISLGVATLIIAISVLNGFEKTLTDKIVDFDSHIKITSYRTILPKYKSTVPELEKYLTNFEPTISAFASKLGIISSKKGKEGLNIIGVQSESFIPGFTSDIIEGEFINDDKPNQIVIGKKLADKLFLEVGDKVTVFALRNDRIPSPSNLPGIEKFIVTGIFESGMAEYDDMYAYITLSDAQQLFDIGDNVTGYNIKFGNISRIDSLTKFLTKKLRYPHAVKSIYQSHRNIFTWIELQKKPIPIILGLIIIVAVFNIIGTLLMVVLEKTNSIGVLKSLGAKGKQIIGIFVIQGIILAVAGIILGNALATLLIQIQLKFDVISLPSSVYFMSTVPILMKADTYLIVAVITFFLCIFASIIPSFIASRIHPVESLRFS